MVTSAEPSSPSGPSLDADPAAIAAAAELEMTTHASVGVDITDAAADAAAADNKDDDSDNVPIPPPHRPIAAVNGNAVEVNLDPSLNGSDFSNLGVTMNSCHPPHTHTPRCLLTVQ